MWIYILVRLRLRKSRFRFRAGNCRSCRRWRRRPVQTGRSVSSSNRIEERDETSGARVSIMVERIDAIRPRSPDPVLSTIWFDGFRSSIWHAGLTGRRHVYCSVCVYMHGPGCLNLCCHVGLYNMHARHTGQSFSLNINRISTPFSFPNPNDSVPGIWKNGYMHHRSIDLAYY